MKRSQQRRIREADGSSREDGFKHGIPAVPVWVDIGYGISGIEYFCRKCPKCYAELLEAIKKGGRVAQEYVLKYGGIA